MDLFNKKKKKKRNGEGKWGGEAALSGFWNPAQCDS